MILPTTTATNIQQAPKNDYYHHDNTYTISSPSTTCHYDDIKRFDSLALSESDTITNNSDTTKAVVVTTTTYGSAMITVSEEQIVKQSSSSSMMGASVNLVNAMMGTGIIGLPLALHLCGFWLGLFFSVLIAYITCMTMHITILCGIKTQTTSLVSLSQKMVGDLGSQVINLIIFFHTAGTAVSYYILLGDTLPSLLALVFPDIPLFSDRRIVIVAFGVLCTLPLSLSRSTAQFAKWSTISVALLMVMLLGVLIRVPDYLSDNIELEVQPISEGMFKGLAIMSLAFGCAQNVFGIHSETRNQRAPKWLQTCSVAILIAFTANMVFAVLAYLCFGSHVKANVLLNFPENDPGIRMVKLALGLFMVLTIPLCIQPCRESVMMMLRININNPTNKQHYSVTIGVFVIILYTGATLTSLGQVFSFIGGFSTTILGFLLPGSMYVYLYFSDLLLQLRRNDKSRKSSLLLLDENEASWKLFIISVISIFIAIPVMYFSVNNAVFV